MCYNAIMHREDDYISKVEDDYMSEINVDAVLEVLEVFRHVHLACIERCNYIAFINDGCIRIYDYAWCRDIVDSKRVDKLVELTNFEKVVRFNNFEYLDDIDI